MANATSIEWTDFNWNFLRGCSRVSEGCRNCYAETVAARFSGAGQPYAGLAKFVDGQARWTGEIGFYEEILLKPLRWKKPRKVFVNSMSDLFHEKVTDEMLDKAFAVMALTPQHTYQILTKRPERMREYLNTCVSDSNIYDCLRGLAQLGYPWGDNIDSWLEGGQHFIDFKQWPLPNVWLGVSVEDQPTANERIPHLLATPAAVRWLSVEPMLGPIQIPGFNSKESWCPRCQEIVLDLLSDPHEMAIHGDTLADFNSAKCCMSVCDILHWIVVGGESGPNARPFDIAWARSVIKQCKAADVPVFVKQLGAEPMDGEYRLRGLTLIENKKGSDPSEWPEDLRIREFPNV